MVPWSPFPKFPKTVSPLGVAAPTEARTAANAARARHRGLPPRSSSAADRNATDQRRAFILVRAISTTVRIASTTRSGSESWI